MQPEAARFMGAAPFLEKSDISLVGIPLDATVSFKGGAAQGPQEIRRYSRNLEMYSPYQQKSLQRVRFFDHGDIVVGMEDEAAFMAGVEREVFRLSAGSRKIVALGGEHTVSFPVVAALCRRYRELAVIQLDAHADLRERYAGNPLSHACVMRRIVELTSPGSIFQFGIRSGTADEFEWMTRHKTLLPFDRRGFARLLKRIGARPVYLTIDIDVFDPSLVPGTGTPEAGGITFREFVDFMPSLKRMHLVGGDVVELAPAIDPAGVSSAVAALLVRELLLLLAG